MATSVETSTYSTTVLDVARDILSDYHGSYVFIAVSPVQNYVESYDLIMCDSIDSSGNYDSFTLYADTFHIVGINVDVDGNFYYTYFSAQMQSWVISRQGALMYSSLPYMPHLQTGEVYYSYAQTVILLAVCVFCLFARIFKHVR